MTWRIYKINDCDWWIARSLEEAKADAAKAYGCDPGDEDEVARARELSDAELDSEDFSDEDGTRLSSFREEMERLIAKGINEPMLFATTEH